ncbi:MAG: hypothetical protein NTV54_08555 [Ignavibacteriales bacterium]|nr:hypothetical protein [Ignavibacteriales bacterium]
MIEQETIEIPKKSIFTVSTLKSVGLIATALNMGRVVVGAFPGAGGVLAPLLMVLIQATLKNSNIVLQKNGRITEEAAQKQNDLVYQELTTVHYKIKKAAQLVEESPKIISTLFEKIDKIQETMNRFEKMYASVYEKAPQAHIESMKKDDEGLNIFRRKGEFWEVRFNEGRINFIRNLLGMNHIAKVLETPLVAFPCEVFSKSPSEGISKAAAAEAGLRKVGDQSNIMIERSSMSDFKRLRELEAEIRNLEMIEGSMKRSPEDEIIAEECRAEIKVIMARINANRRPDEDKFIKNRAAAVSKAIKEAIENLFKYDDQLARHLDNSIIRGKFVCYSPNETIEWTLQ